jgi:phosphopantothenoylcysteine decarboxylase/phosphopantothenate--cysteine ligase
MEGFSDDISGKLGDELSGKTIVHCITGSISAYKAPDIARHLIRHGAEVISVMSESAQKVIHKNTMEWATGNEVITELSGKIEHVLLTSGRGKADLILIAPATANTIGKIANGIDDTPVTSVISSALGAKIPILVAPAMHETMIKHSIIQENIKKLKEHGVIFIPSRFEEGKAKIANESTIFEYVLNVLAKKDLLEKKVLVTGGPTIEKIDAIRFITNASSGKTGVELAREASGRGAKVTLITGPTREDIEEWIDTIKVETAREMYDAVIKKLGESKYDIVIASAAVSDYYPSNNFTNKIRSEETEKLQLELIRTPKIIDAVKRVSPESFLIIFKAEYDVSSDELIKRGMERVREVNADMAVLNDVSKIGFGSDENQVLLLSKEGKVKELPRVRKRIMARIILDDALSILSKR